MDDADRLNQWGGVLSDDLPVRHTQSILPKRVFANRTPMAFLKQNARFMNVPTFAAITAFKFGLGWQLDSDPIAGKVVLTVSAGVGS